MPAPLQSSRTRAMSGPPPDTDPALLWERVVTCRVALRRERSQPANSSAHSAADFPDRPLAVNELFRFPTVADLARRLGAGPGPAKGQPGAGGADFADGGTDSGGYDDENGMDGLDGIGGLDDDRGRRRAARRSDMAPARPLTRRRGAERRTSDPSKDADD